jgi:hypothetical protein
VGLEGFGKMIQFNYLVESRTRDLPVHSIVPQTLRFRVLQITKKAFPLLRNAFTCKIRRSLLMKLIENWRLQFRRRETAAV